MTDEEQVVIKNDTIPGIEFKHVTLSAFTNVWQGLGWTITTDPEFEDLPYVLTSLEKGAPFGLATLDGSGNVVQNGPGGGGGVTVGTMNAAISAAIALVTPASIGAIPTTTPVITYVNGTLQLQAIAGHPTPVANVTQAYSLTSDGSTWVQDENGSRTQLTPAWPIVSVELATEKTVNSLTLSTILSGQLSPDAVYDIQVGPVGYESTVAASGERIRVTFDPPPGSTGFYGVQAMNSAGASSGTLAPSWVAKQLTETFDLGGSGAGQPRWFTIRGHVYTGSHLPPPDAESNMDFRVRLTTLDGAGVPLVPGKIYGANTANYDSAVMTLTRLS